VGVAEKNGPLKNVKMLLRCMHRTINSVDNIQVVPQFYDSVGVVVDDVAPSTASTNCEQSRR